MQMEEKILDFCRLLRKGGINISLSQIADALQAVGEVGFEKEDFFYALCCTLVSEKAELPLFEKVFNLYFSSAFALGGKGGDANFSEGNQDRGELALEFPNLELVDDALGEGRGRGGGASPALLLVKAVIEGNYPLLRSLAELAIKSLGTLGLLELKNFEKTLETAKVNIGWYEAVNRLEQIRERERVSSYTYSEWLKNLDYLEETMRKLLENLFLKIFGRDALEELVAAANLKEKECYRLTNLEIEEIRLRISKLARKLAARKGRRYQRAKRGQVDLRRTFQKALNTGKVPIHLKHRKRVLSKPELVLLCDVSGSVAVFSEFMLQLVYTIQNRFRKVRSFLFVDTVDEVTQYFWNQDIEEALSNAFGKAHCSISGFSDFGKVFATFATKFLPGISPQSTLIILGDARNNWRPDEKEFLEKISKHVKKVLWFNPQPREKWDTEDSIMSVYAPYCTQVFECRNLKQLEKVVEAIL